MPISNTDTARNVDFKGREFRIYFDCEHIDVRRPCHICGGWDVGTGYPDIKLIDVPVTSAMRVTRVQSIHDYNTHEDIPVDLLLGRKIIRKLKQEECQPTCKSCTDSIVDGILRVMPRKVRLEAAQAELDPDIEEGPGL